MFEKLGVVTNSWARSMEAGTRFEDLVALFVRNGFRHIEVRDGDYLRRSEFGRFIHEIEEAAGGCSHSDWQRICDEIHTAKVPDAAVTEEHRSVFDRLINFFQMSQGVVFSYALSHPWLTRPADIETDNDHISRAIQLAYLLCPQQARLRLVALEPVDPVDGPTATSNLKRYRSLLPDYPVILAVENALQPAPLILELAVAGGALLAYDEANNYRSDGGALNTPEEFWDAVKLENLASIHLKQKAPQGVLAQLGDGFVDIAALIERLRNCGYSGDLLLEYQPTDQPLTDAIQSRTILMGC
jgi:sugar phosphate isomerase/epimerase